MLVEASASICATGYNQDLRRGSRLGEDPRRTMRVSMRKRRSRRRRMMMRRRKSRRRRRRKRRRRRRSS